MRFRLEADKRLYRLGFGAGYQATTCLPAHWGSAANIR